MNVTLDEFHRTCLVPLYSVTLPALTLNHQLDGHG